MPDTFEIPSEAVAPEPVTIALDTPTDPEAPYGRFENGKPRKTPPKPKKQAAAPKATAPRASTKKAGADFRPVVKQGMQMLAMGLAGLGRRNRAFLADAATLQIAADDGAKVVNDMAAINPAIERLLTTSAPAVPYIAAANFFFQLTVQIAANHGKALPGMQAEDPEQLAAAMEQQMMRAAQQQQNEDQAAEHQYSAAA
jgi:hypothetical protein